MRTFVWVDSWQQQCCGEDFQVGSDVRWSVVPQDSPHEWVSLLLGQEWADKVGYREEHHDDDGTTVITGAVGSIREVTCRRTLTVHAAGKVLVPIEGSGMLREVAVADKWGAEPGNNLRDQVTFDGWIVELELVSRVPSV